MPTTTTYEAVRPSPSTGRIVSVMARIEGAPISAARLLPRTGPTTPLATDGKAGGE